MSNSLLNYRLFLPHYLYSMQISIDAAALAKASDTIWTLVDRLSIHLEWGGAVSIHLPGDRAALYWTACCQLD
jgi:hypothetical protein